MSKTFESFGKYLLLEKIASGGMAEVYLAKSLGASGIAKFVAIKRILPQYSDNPEFIDMFKEEAKIAVNLNHGNVVSIFDFGVEKETFYLVMEYVEGQNLRQVLNHLKKETKTFSIDQIVYVIKEVAGGLDHAHRCIDGTTGRPLNITHRDMSPQNVMVSFEGEVKIVDFGIAKAESQVEHTRAGTIKGKFGYMSPEQADGQPVDLRTDIFSLGIVLWELLANDRLFTSNSEAGTLRKIRECQIPSLRKINPAVPPELERICNKALAKDKSLRYQTAASFHRDLNRFLNTQYPEFSAHDFSVFMKSAFSQMFIDNRKKLMEYAKATHALNADKAEPAATTSTMTASLTSADVVAPPARPPDVKPPPPTAAPLPVDTNSSSGLQSQLGDIRSRTSSSIDFSKLSSSKRSELIKKTSISITNSSGTNSGVYGGRGGTSTHIRRRNQKQEAPSSGWAVFFLVMVVFGGAFYYLYTSRAMESRSFGDWLQNNPIARVLKGGSKSGIKLNPGDDTGQATEASKAAKMDVVIESNPLGARIYIDGKDTNQFTPAIYSMDVNREFNVSLRLEGYLPFESKQKVTGPGESIKAKLKSLAQMGYVNIDVVNGGNDPVIIVNGTRISEKLPIKLYAVPADTPVLVQAFNPFASLSDEQTITVNVSQKRDIRLVLTKKK